jgi:hypothetical protein
MLGCIPAVMFLNFIFSEYDAQNKEYKFMYRLQRELRNYNAPELQQEFTVRAT